MRTVEGLRSCLCLVVVSALALGALPALAQEGYGGGGGEEMSPEMAAMMDAMAKAMTPGEPHASLAQAVGTWKMQVTFWTEPGAEPQMSEATAERRMIMGGRYLEETVQGTAMGQPFEGRSYSGYDNVTGKHWTTWFDSMSTGIMYSEGEEDESGRVVYHGTTSDPMTGDKTKVKTVIWSEGEGKEKMEMYMRMGDDWFKSMEITSVRQ